MLAALGLFFKNKVFSGTGLILTFFGVIFAVFLLSNSNVILSKFGFETTTVLKSDLTKTQGELKTAVGINQNLNKQIEDIIDNNVKKETVIVEASKETAAAKTTVEKIIKKRDSTTKDSITVLVKETSITEEVIKIPAKEYNRVSEANITALHEAYDQLFKQAENNDA